MMELSVMLGLIPLMGVVRASRTPLMYYPPWCINGISLLEHQLQGDGKHGAIDSTTPFLCS